MSSYYETKTYAKFRHELLTLCPHMDEREVYKNWWMYQCHSNPDNGWHIQQTPMRGVDSKYHYFYITTTPNGEIYNGIHSTLDLDDGYQGSGDEIRNYQASGVKLNTTILEFFRTREEALAMEKYVVNDLFLVEFGVLNKVPGGDDSRHGDDSRNVDSCCWPMVEPAKYNSGLLPSNKSQSTILCKNISVEMPFGDKVEVPVVDSAASPVEVKPEPQKDKKPTTKKCPKNWFTLERLTVPVGGELVYIADKSIIATALNEVDKIKVNGRSGTLKEMTNKIAGKKVPNCLAFWSWNGKSLLDIKNEILKKGG